jgi:hypothetical protein
MLSFWLSGRARVVFVVRGPAPDCSTAATFAYPGHRGRNRVRFTGRIGKRRLSPGEYTISPALIRGTRPARNASVGVAVSRDGSTPARVEQDCNPSSLSGRATVAGRLTGTASASKAALRKPESKPRKRKFGVLGAFKAPKLPELSLPQPSDGLPWFVGIGALGLLLLSGLGLLAYVVNFLRRANA